MINNPHPFGSFPAALIFTGGAPRKTAPDSVKFEMTTVIRDLMARSNLAGCARNFGPKKAAVL